MLGKRVALAVPANHVKTVKTALENKRQLDRTSKITPENPSIERIGQRRMVVCTTLHHSLMETDQEKTTNRPDEEIKHEILSNLGLQHLSNECSLLLAPYSSEKASAMYRNPLLKALKSALDALPEAMLASLDLSSLALLSSFPESYTIYKPMLLLSHNAFSSSSWQKLLSRYPVDSEVLRTVWRKAVEGVGATHLAINAGIPIQTYDKEFEDAENILRSPVNLTPVYGDFGPLPTPERISNPTKSDFLNAFWVAHTQNGIQQTWAPLYTMFSRGNIREKSRLLTLPSVLRSIEEGKEAHASSNKGEKLPSSAIGCTAVDLYAGIGYFTFSYKKTGMNKVLCWELNPWSVEGLRRGANLNRWTTQIFKEFPNTEQDWSEWINDVKDVDFLVFQQSNEFALPVMTALKNSSLSIPPVRHVNLGLLPKSTLSWPTAVSIIDRSLGGWIHAHENVGVNDIEKRKLEAENEMQEYLDAWEATLGSSSSKRNVKAGHVEQVKTFAPGVVHVVMDVDISGMKALEK